MNILMFGWEFPPFISGGLGTACFEMTRAITGAGHSITFVLPLYDKSCFPSTRVSRGDVGSQTARIPGTQTAIDNLTLFHLPARLHPYLRAGDYSLASLPDPEQFSDVKAIYGSDLVSEVYRYGQSAAALSGTLSFDVIHSHDWMTIPAALLARGISSKPWILHVHSLEYDRSGEQANRQIVEIEREGLEKADRIIAVSARTKKMITERYGICPQKISVIYNAVSRTETKIVNRNADKGHRQTVLFLGRITFQKGPDYFVEAAALVLQALPEVVFVMAGDGDMLEQVMQRVGELGIGSHFHFTGFLQGEDIERIFSESDLYVMPSVSEPFGISPLEAMSYDVPVIISRQSGVSEILKNALKVDFWNVAEMASLIIAVLQRPALASALTVEAHKELKDIRWIKSAEQIIDLYREVTKNFNRR
ncbi:MAG: glycosyltransferase family 4 protein [Syntrophales bacterium]